MSLIQELDEITSGFIPEELIYVLAQRENRNVAGDFIDMTPVFPLDADNKKVLDTAVRWAERRWGFDESHKMKRGEDRKPVKKPQQITLKNEPKEGYRVIGVDRRNEGGRAWKVVTPAPDYFLFDIREEYLLSALLNNGCDKGGYLKGKYVWAKVGSQMKLVAYGSELYYKILQAHEKKFTKEVSLKDLEVGGVYEMKNGTIKIYLGKVNSIQFVEGKFDYNRSFLGKGGYVMQNRWKLKSLDKKFAFYELGYLTDEEKVQVRTDKNFLEFYKKYIKRNQYYSNNVKLNNGSKFYKKINQMTVDANWSDVVKRETIKYWIKDDKVNLSSQDAARSYNYYSEILNMSSDINSPAVLNDVFDKKYLDTTK